MSKADHLTTRATQLFALALQARRDGLLEYADELTVEAQHELDAAIALASQLSPEAPIYDHDPPDAEVELGY